MGIYCAIAEMSNHGPNASGCSRMAQHQARKGGTRMSDTELSHGPVGVSWQCYCAMGVSRCRSGSGGRHLATNKSHDTVRQTE